MRACPSSAPRPARRGPRCSWLLTAPARHVVVPFLFVACAFRTRRYHSRSSGVFLLLFLSQKYPEDRRCHSQNPEQLVAGPCPVLYGLALSCLLFRNKRVMSSSFFFFFSSINGDGVFVCRNRWCPLCSVTSGRSMVRVGHGGRPGGRVGLVLRKFSKLWLCDFRPFHWALDAFWSIGDEGRG